MKSKVLQFTTIIGMVVFYIVFSNGVALSGNGTEKNGQSPYLKSLENLLHQQSQAETVTAKVEVNPQFPNIINISSGYFLPDMLSLLDQMPQTDIPAFKQWVKENQEWVPAPILMELGRLEFEDNLQEGLMLFTAGRVRAAYDSGRCVERDRGIHKTPLLMLMMRNKKLVEYSRDHHDEFVAAVEKAVSWDKAHSYTASPVWVCAYSMSAAHFVANTPQPVNTETLLVPAIDWPGIRNKAHELFLTVVLQQKK